MNDECDQWWYQQDCELQRLELHLKELFAIYLLLMLENNREKI